MSSALKVLMDSWDSPGPAQGSAEGASGTGLRIVPMPLGDADTVPPTRQSPPHDWTKLIERVQRAAQHSRDVEAQAQEQELRVQQLLEQVREDIRRAEDRARAAEDRAREFHARAEALVRAADERTKRAELRADTAERWLGLVQDTLTTEFSGLPAID